MRNDRLITLIACGSLSAAAVAPSSLQAAPKLFGLFGKDETKAPTQTSELAAQESKAAALINEAAVAEKAGDSAKAAKTYAKIGQLYPFTKAAATALFRAGQQFEQAGKPEKAFDQFQTLIDSHSQSPEFSTALERQFSICNTLRTKRGGFLGVGAVTSENLIGMYEKVIKNGSRSTYAPKAQFAIGELYADLANTAKSQEAFQKVVDTYPESPEAPDAAYKIGRVNFDVSQKTRDASNLTQAREAFESAVTLFGQNPMAADAQQTLMQINEVEAEKAFKTAEFYLKKKQVRSAAIYLQDVLKCPTSPKFAEAKEKLDALTAQNPDLVVPRSPVPPVTAAGGGAAGDGGSLTGVPSALPSTKTRPDYFGPPGQKPRAKMRLGQTPTGPSTDPSGISGGADVPGLPQPGQTSKSSSSLLPSPENVAAPTSPASTDAPMTDLPAPASIPAPAVIETPPAVTVPPPADPLAEPPKSGN